MLEVLPATVQDVLPEKLTISDGSYGRVRCFRGALESAGATQEYGDNRWGWDQSGTAVL